MLLLSQQIPIQFSGLAPLLELCKILSHKQKLFTRMPEHKGIGHFQIRKLVVVKPRHLINHRTFQMHHLIMGQNQNIVLTVGIGHGKGHEVMGSFAEIRVQLHIFQEIIHPAHIPLERKSQAVPFRLIRHLRPGGGFLRNHHHAGVASPQAGIEMLKELNRFQILISSVFIGHPLPVLLAVVQIEHGSHGVYPQPVHMILFHPEQRIGYEEIFHLIHLIVEDLCSPVRMFSLSRIRIFK